MRSRNWSVSWRVSVAPPSRDRCSIPGSRSSTTGPINSQKLVLSLEPVGRLGNADRLMTGPIRDGQWTFNPNGGGPAAGRGAGVGAQLPGDKDDLAGGAAVMGDGPGVNVRPRVVGA